MINNEVEVNPEGSAITIVLLDEIQKLREENLMLREKLAEKEQGECSSYNGCATQKKDQLWPSSAGQAQLLCPGEQSAGPNSAEQALTPVAVNLITEPLSDKHPNGPSSALCYYTRKSYKYYINVLWGKFEAETYKQLKIGPQHLKPPNHIHVTGGWNKSAPAEKVPPLELFEVLAYKGQIGRRPMFCCKVGDKSTGDLNDLYWLDIEQMINLEPKCVFVDYIRSLMLFRKETYTAVMRKVRGVDINIYNTLYNMTVRDHTLKIKLMMKAREERLLEARKLKMGLKDTEASS